MKNVPNALSILRMIASFFLLVFTPTDIIWLIIYILCGITDVLDGFIARRFKLESKLGSILDTIADVLFYLFSVGSVLLFINLSIEITIGIIIILCLKLSEIILVLKYKLSFESLHTLANKVAGILIFILLPLAIVNTNVIFIIGIIALALSIVELYLLKKQI